MLYFTRSTYDIKIIIKFNLDLDNEQWRQALLFVGEISLKIRSARCSNAGTFGIYSLLLQQYKLFDSIRGLGDLPAESTSESLSAD